MQKSVLAIHISRYIVSQPPLLALGMPPVTRHPSPVTRHPSPVTRTCVVKIEEIGEEDKGANWDGEKGEGRREKREGRRGWEIRGQVNWRLWVALCAIK